MVHPSTFVEQVERENWLVQAKSSGNKTHRAASIATSAVMFNKCDCSNIEQITMKCEIMPLKML
jgi:hypothetical protein